MNELILTPEYNPFVAVKVWKEYAPKFGRIGELSANTETPESLCKSIGKGKLLLWTVGTLEGVQAILLTQVIVNGNGTKELCLFCLYALNGGIEQHFYRAGLKDLNDFAKHHKCLKIHFFTVRDSAFARKLEPIGFRADRTRFSVEVE